MYWFTDLFENNKKLTQRHFYTKLLFPILNHITAIELDFFIRAQIGVIFDNWLPVPKDVLCKWFTPMTYLLFRQYFIEDILCYDDVYHEKLSPLFSDFF